MAEVILRLLRSSTFRLAFLGGLLFTLTGLGMLGMVRWSTFAVLDQRVDGAIQVELERLNALYAQAGFDALAEEVNARANSTQGRQRAYLLEDAQGGVVAGNMEAWPGGAVEEGGHLRFPASQASGEPGSPVRAEVDPLDHGGRLLVGRLQSDRVAFEAVINAAMLGGAGLSLVLGCGVGLVLARRSLVRIDQINRTAQTILDGQLHGRVPLGGSGDEFDQLAVNLNIMLERIERLVEAMRAVTRNVAHDLRTPLNRLRNRLELALMEPQPQAEAETVMAEAIIEVDAILATFNALLSIARLEGRLPQENFQDLALDELAAAMAELYAPLAEDQGLVLETVLQPGLSVRGDRHLLSQALANLLDNAIKYTPPGGKVVVSVAKDGDKASLSVIDNGPGIPLSQWTRVLEPFVRLDETRQSPGAGLGLSLVAAIAEAHGAALRLEDAKPGLTVSLDLTLPKHGQRINPW